MSLAHYTELGVLGQGSYGQVNPNVGVKHCTPTVPIGGAVPTPRTAMEPLSYPFVYTGFIFPHFLFSSLF